MKKIILVIAIFFTTSLLFISCKSDKKDNRKVKVTSDKHQNDKEVAYQCPMKCEKEKTYKKEGKCPVCKMKLRNKTGEHQSK